MNRTILRDAVRTIRRTFSKFLTLFAIVALGIAFFVGVSSSSPIMAESVDLYYDENNLMDFQIYSNYGFDQEDIFALSQIEGIEKAEGRYFFDGIGKLNESEKVVRFFSYDENSTLNNFTLQEGNLPQKENECLAEISEEMVYGYEIGDKITVTHPENDLSEQISVTEFTVVGLITSAEFIHKQRESSTLDNRDLSTFIYLPKEVFVEEIYTNALLIAENAKEYNSFSDEYFEYLQPIKENLEQEVLILQTRRSSEIFKEAMAEYEKGLAEYNDGLATYEENIQNIADLEELGQTVPEENKIELENVKAELDEAKTELDDVKVEIDSLEQGEWTVLDRDMHYGSVQYKDTVAQMEAIAAVFPIFFFLVAALVCLTTMTRMVDEERGQIGILRALGYSKFLCSFKYLFYSFIATFSGGIVGSILGLMVFPPVIYSTWGLMYALPEMRYELPIDYIILANSVFIVVMILTTISVTRGQMKEVTSQILRPKSPKLGKKIILEKITFIWKRMSFTSKVTARNLIRYKRRFFMTVIGISGCTALLVAGFGIRVSVSDIVTRQYDDLTLYNGIISFEEELSTEKKSELTEEISALNEVEKIELITSFNWNFWGENKDLSQVSSVQIYENDDQLKELKVVKDYRDGNELFLSDDNVLISEKLSELLELKVGDLVTIENENNVEKQVEIGGIFQHYINHEVLMSMECYSNLFGEELAENASLLLLNNSDIASEIRNFEGVNSLYLTQSAVDSLSKTIDGLNIVVIVIIVSAGLLAFIVLGNLSNINISERQRELATLKVLGFTNKEVNSYMFKENMLLTFFGALFGMILGTFLHRFIITLVEMDFVMFLRLITLSSLLYAAIMTFVFSFLVNIIVTRKLKKIQMVESLKSIE